MLYDFIVDVFINLDLEKFLDAFFTEDNVPASGHICYDEVRTEEFGNREISINKDIKIYLDNIRNDGTVIETKEVNIEDYVDLEDEKEKLMECGFWDDTDEYIETALGKFVDDSKWSFGLRNGDDYIEDIEDWPVPKEDGSWIDEDGNTLKPCMWFGNGYDEWLLDGDNLDFWLSACPENYVVEVIYDAFAGCYGGGIPGFEEVVESCPIKIEADDTPESIDKKIQEFLVKQYKEAHK